LAKNALQGARMEIFLLEMINNWLKVANIKDEL
jgi:hypothetical protein